MVILCGLELDVERCGEFMGPKKNPRTLLEYEYTYQGRYTLRKQWRFCQLALVPVTALGLRALQTGLRAVPADWHVERLDFPKRLKFATVYEK
jgi:hypothetical protein